MTMNEEEYDDYLVDKAKELLNEQVSDAAEEEVETPDTDREPVEKAEAEGKKKIPATWDPQEVEHLARNRKNMSNDELKEFLEKESDLQRELEKIDDWKGFNRWEERFMIQNNLDMEPEDIAQELDRGEREVRLKMRMLGFDVDF